MQLCTLLFGKAANLLLASCHEWQLCRSTSRLCCPTLALVHTLRHFGVFASNESQVACGDRPTQVICLGQVFKNLVEGLEAIRGYLAYLLINITSPTSDGGCGGGNCTGSIMTHRHGREGASRLVSNLPIMISSPACDGARWSKSTSRIITHRHGCERARCRTARHQPRYGTIISPAGDGGCRGDDRACSKITHRHSCEGSGCRLLADLPILITSPARDGSRGGNCTSSILTY